MLMVVIIGKWSDDRVRAELSTTSSCTIVLDTVVISGEDVCCSVMWYALLMTSAISCPVWSSVYE